MSIKSSARKLWAVILETPLLASHSRELYTLALKQGHISSLQGNSFAIISNDFACCTDTSEVFNNN